MGQRAEGPRGRMEEFLSEVGVLVVKRRTSTKKKSQNCMR